MSKLRFVMDYSNPELQDILESASRFYGIELPEIPDGYFVIFGLYGYETLHPRNFEKFYEMKWALMTKNDQFLILECLRAVTREPYIEGLYRVADGITKINEVNGSIWFISVELPEKQTKILEGFKKGHEPVFVRFTTTDYERMPFIQRYNEREGRLEIIGC